MRSIARADHASVDLWGARALASALALLACFPLLGPGYTLAYDMVFVPDPVLNGRTLGLDGSVPRAVPMDFLLGVVGQVLPMPVVQQGALLAAVGLAALGAWRLSPATSLPGAAAAATTYGWSAYVAERLAIGHWSLLLGYAVLPWLVLHALRAAREPARLPWPLLLLVAAGACAAPTAGVLTAVLALALVWVLPVAGRSRALVTAAVVLFNAVWVLPGLLAAGSLDRTAAGVSAFAVSADTPLGPVASAATGGGIWNQLVHPASRVNSPVPVLLLLVLVAVALLGLVVLLRAGDRRPGVDAGDRRAAAVLLGLGVLGLALALASTSEPGRDLLGWATANAPGAGILRDSQKWLAWWLLALAYGVGPGLERLVAPTARTAFVLACAALVPLVCLPDLTAGVGGRLHRSQWPGEYAQVAGLLDTTHAEGAVLVLPWHAFRAWPWTEDTTVLDPWPRLLERDVVVRDDLELTSGTVSGEDPRARQVGALVARGRLDSAALRELGIRYVLTDLSTASTSAGRVPPVPGTTVHEGPLLRVVDLGPVEAGSGAPTPPSRGARAGLLAIDAAALAGVVVALAGCARRVPRGWRRRQKSLLSLRRE